MESPLKKNLVTGICLLLAAVVLVLTVNAVSRLGEMKQSVSSAPVFGAMHDSDMEGTAAPDFSLEDLDGNTLTLSEYEGGVVLLDFWATWCGPCIKETPTFITLDEQYGEDEFKIIGLAVNDTESKVRSYAEKQGIQFSLAMVSDDVQNDYGGIMGLPTHFLIDKQGIIRHVWMGGPNDLRTFQERIDNLLAE